MLLLHRGNLNISQTKKTSTAVIQLETFLPGSPFHKGVNSSRQTRVLFIFTMRFKPVGLNIYVQTYVYCYTYDTCKCTHSPRVLPVNKRIILRAHHKCLLFKFGFACMLCSWCSSVLISAVRHNQEKNMAALAHPISPRASGTAASVLRKQLPVISRQPIQLLTLGHALRRRAAF